MNHLKTKIFGALTLFALLSCFAMQAVQAQSQSSDAKDTALIFMNDVLLLDMTKSNASLAVNSVSYPELNGAVQESVKYNIKTTDTNAGAISFMFRNNVLVFCSTAELKDTSTLYAISLANVIDRAKGIMQRYAVFAKDTSLTEMADLLIDVKAATNATMETGNTKLVMTKTDGSTVFWWKHVFNGVEYNEVQLIFEGDELVFSDYLSRYRMGNIDIKVSEEQAVNAAYEQVKNYPYLVNYADGKETSVTIREFNITEERTVATLVPCERGDGLLYPRWMVEVYLDKTFGNVYGFRVDFWADSGEMLSINPLAVGGYYPTESPAAQIQEGNTSTSTSTYIILATASIALVITVVAVVIKKR